MVRNALHLAAHIDKGTFFRGRECCLGGQIGRQQRTALDAHSRQDWQDNRGGTAPKGGEIVNGGNLGCERHWKLLPVIGCLYDSTPRTEVQLTILNLSGKLGKYWAGIRRSAGTPFPKQHPEDCWNWQTSRI